MKAFYALVALLVGLIAYLQWAPLPEIEPAAVAPIYEESVIVDNDQAEIKAPADYDVKQNQQAEFADKSMLLAQNAAAPIREPHREGGAGDANESVADKKTAGTYKQCYRECTSQFEFTDMETLKRKCMAIGQRSGEADGDISLCIRDLFELEETEFKGIEKKCQQRCS